MGTKEINDLALKASPASTDEILLQETGGGTCKKAVYSTIGIPAGVILPYSGSSAPSGWLIANGAKVSQSTYSTLYAVSGIEEYTPLWTNGTVYSVGDLVRQIADDVIYECTVGGTSSGTDVSDDVGVTWALATDFYLPDLRAATPVGVGTSTQYTQNETVALGDYDDDQIQGHIHYAGIGSDSGTDIYGNDGGADIPGSSTARCTQTGGAASTQPITSVPKTDGSNGTPRTGNVTHGKRVGTTYIIKV
jgi:microcystin-dependent protein